ncbi:11034_t:CDS:1 [Paraglomus occultum]|uniref:11034_t:CDS:1 n=1 Tax=Paraglomus occultum TaxID=144539 RepID=A0A9N9B4X1_9GLOM|nr:11034_t:CDS:1 [Paraglomus occultum]
MDSWTTLPSTTSRPLKTTRPSRTVLSSEKKNKNCGKREKYSTSNNRQRKKTLPPSYDSDPHDTGSSHTVQPFSRSSQKRAASLFVGLPEEKSTTISRKRPKGMKTLPFHTTEPTQSMCSGSTSGIIATEDDTNYSRLWNDTPWSTNYPFMGIPGSGINFGKSFAGITSSHENSNLPSIDNLERVSSTEVAEWDICIDNAEDDNIQSTEREDEEVEKILEGHIQDFLKKYGEAERREALIEEKDTVAADKAELEIYVGMIQDYMKRRGGNSVFYIGENYYKEVETYPQMLNRLDSIGGERILEVLGLKLEIAGLRAFHFELANMYGKLMKKIAKKEKSFQVKLDI